MGSNGSLERMKRHAPPWLGRNGARQRTLPVVDSSSLCDNLGESEIASETTVFGGSYQ